MDQAIALSGRKISAMEAAQDGIQRETAVGGGRKKGEEASGRRQT